MKPINLKGLKMKPSKVYERQKEELGHRFEDGVPILTEEDMPQKNVFDFDDSRFDEEIKKRGATKVDYEDFNELTDEQEKENIQAYYESERLKRRLVAARDTLQAFRDNETPVDRMKRKVKEDKLLNPINLGNVISNKLSDAIKKYRLDRVESRRPDDYRSVMDNLPNLEENEEVEPFEGFKAYVGPETRGIPYYYLEDELSKELEENDKIDELIEDLDHDDKMDLIDEHILHTESEAIDRAENQLSDTDLLDMENDEDEELTDSVEPQEIQLSEEDLMDLEYHSQAIGLTLTDGDLKDLEPPQKPLQL